MRFLEGTKLDFSDVLLVPQHSTIASRKEVMLTRYFTFKYSHEVWEGIPIISSNMSSVTNRNVACVMADNKMIACIPKSGSDCWGLDRRYSIRSFGLKDDVKITNDLFICLDVANGYMEAVVNRIKFLRKQVDCVIIVGNVVTPEMVTSLILAGADIVKVGIGSGSACATRLKTGVGYPQLSAVMECANAAHGLGGHIISDGGCTCAGDVVKAFAAGADFVMLGGLLAGHNENGIEFSGEASKTMVENKAGGLSTYRAAEGWELQFPSSKGALQSTLQDICGGIRSACSYVGARRLKDLPKCATFIRVNNQLNKSLWEHRV